MDVERVSFDEHLRRKCGASRITAAGKAALVRWPYLQKVTDRSAELLWVSQGSVVAELTLSSPEGVREQSVVGRHDLTAAPLEGSQFVAKLSGLAQGSIYCYRLSDAGGTTWFEGAFATAPWAGQPAAVQFSAMGDLGARTADQFAVLAQLKGVRSDFVVLTGDIAYDQGTRAELESNVFGMYREMMSAIPFFPASGNLDYGTDDAEPFRDAFALPENGGAQGLERWYSHDWGPLHVVVLDTEKIGPVQQRWLKADLAANASPFTVVVMHRPPYSSGSRGSSPAARDAFVPLFEQRVDLVLAGHDHDYERTRQMGRVTYIVTGGGGRGTRAVGKSEFTAVSVRVAHFVHVSVDEELMLVVAIDGLGVPFDAVVIPLRTTTAGS
jgi:3',5'-cyclic AMP phosphodiesterase CpdA